MRRLLDNDRISWKCCFFLSINAMAEVLSVPPGRVLFSSVFLLHNEEFNMSGATAYVFLEAQCLVMGFRTTALHGNRHKTASCNAISS
jgi:hypothetical protein